MTQHSAIQQKNMSDGQLRTNAVNDVRLLEAMAMIPRQEFVPNAFKNAAFVDEEIPLGNGRFMLEPLVIATLLQHAKIMPTHRVLCLGTGFGYAPALLSALGGLVIAVESDAELLAQAKTRTAPYSKGNIEFHHGPLEAGWSAGAPYDLIFIDGGVSVIPPKLPAQLGHHGRLVTVEVTHPRAGSLTGLGQYLTMVQEGDKDANRREGNAFVSILPGFTSVETFTF